MTESVLGSTVLADVSLAGNAQLLAPAALAQPAAVTPNAGTPVLVIDVPVPGQEFAIDATPTMPAIKCQARIVGVAPDPTPRTAFNWFIEIVEPRQAGTCASAGVSCVYFDQANGLVGGVWLPQFQGYRGGDVRIGVSVTYAGSVLRAETRVKIIGTNPPFSEVHKACGGSTTDAAKIACHESGMQQFRKSGLPVLGPGGDVGIMQLCGPKPATCDERWNWRANVAAGIALFTTHSAAARQYLDTHKVDGKWPNDKNMTKEQVLQRESIKRYNGRVYWTWDEKSSMWLAQPPGDYTDKVLGSTGCR